ncbi:hypothetical protein ACHAW5_009430 [Stephanodiscus triporus]|uniref:Uncharacterized protein n=1 Tax=Stephanodiscus triporus TaxID=2934178 RepID=A0ABD3NX42_9STRA
MLARRGDSAMAPRPGGPRPKHPPPEAARDVPLSPRWRDAIHSVSPETPPPSAERCRDDDDDDDHEDKFVPPETPPKKQKTMVGEVRTPSSFSRRHRPSPDPSSSSSLSSSGDDDGFDDDDVSSTFATPPATTTTLTTTVDGIDDDGSPPLSSSRRRARRHHQAHRSSTEATPFTPRSRRMMMDLSIDGCRQRQPSEEETRPRSRPPSPGMDVSSSSSSSYLFGGGGGVFVVPTSSAYATPRSTPSRRPPPHASRTTTTTTPIGLQRGSVFEMPPPRCHASSSTTTPGSEDGRCHQDGASSSHATTTSGWWCNRSPPSSLASTSSCASSSADRHCATSSTRSRSRLVPLTVLSRDGSPVVHRPSSSRPSPAAGGTTTSLFPSPLMRSLDRAYPPPNNNMTTPTSLPSLRRSDDVASVVGCTPTRSTTTTTATTGRLPPKIWLTPRGARCQSPVPSLPLPTPLGGPASMSSSFGMEDEEFIMTEMDSLLDGFGHHQADRHESADDNRRREGRAGPRRRRLRGERGGEGGGEGLDRVESEEAEMVALLTKGPLRMLDAFRPLSPRRDRHHDVSPRRPMPSITLNLDTILGEGVHEVPFLPSRSPSFLPRPVPFVQGGSRSLFDTTKDPIEGILLADAIAEAAKSNEPLTDDEGSEFNGDHSDFLLDLPRREVDGGIAPPAPSSNPSQAETTRKKISFRPTTAAGLHAPSLRRRAPSSSQDGPHDTWETGLALSSAAAEAAASHEGPNKRAFSDAAFAVAHRDSPSEPARELSSCGPKHPRRNSNDADVVMLTGGGDRQSSSVAHSLLSMSSLCGLSILHEIHPGGKAGPDNEQFQATAMSLPPTESSEFMSATIQAKLFRSEFSENSLGFSLDSNDGCVYQRDLFTPPVSMD